jgi:hypothetical protein
MGIANASVIPEQLREECGFVGSSGNDKAFAIGRLRIDDGLITGEVDLFGSGTVTAGTLDGENEIDVGPIGVEGMLDVAHRVRGCHHRCWLYETGDAQHPHANEE